MSSQNSSHFKFNLVNDSNQSISQKDKILLKYYFEDVDFKKAKHGLMMNLCPKKDTSYKTKIQEALNPELYGEHLITKYITYDDSSRKFEVIDSTYYESIPYTSIVNIVKRHYDKDLNLFNRQVNNSTEISNTTRLFYTANNFIYINGNNLQLVFELKNMGVKPIEQAHGLIILKDNYDNELISAEYSFIGKTYFSLKMKDLKEALNHKGWLNPMSIGKEVDMYLIKKIEDLGQENLILEFKPTKIKFTDGSYLVR